MSDELGLLNLVVSPILERVVKEDRLSGDQQQRQRTIKSKVEKKAEDSSSSNETEEANDSMSSHHIDLRI